MTSCGRHNVSKHREIENGDQYIILDISSKIYCIDKREFISSESSDSIGRPGKGLTTYQDLSTKRPNKKQKVRFAITKITHQDINKLLKKFNISPYLGYKKEQAHNEPTEAYLFITTYINKLNKIKNHDWIHNQEVKSDVNEKICFNDKIVHVNETIQYEINLINGEKL